MQLSYFPLFLATLLVTKMVLTLVCGIDNIFYIISVLYNSIYIIIVILFHDTTTCVCYETPHHRPRNSYVVLCEYGRKQVVDFLSSESSSLIG